MSIHEWKIDLHNQGIGDQGFIAILKMLEQTTSPIIVNLNIEDNKIGDAGALYLAEMMRSGNWPEHLHLHFHFGDNENSDANGKNAIGFKGFEALGGALQSDHCPSDLEFEFKNYDTSNYVMIAFFDSYDSYKREQALLKEIIDTFLKSYAQTFPNNRARPASTELTNQLQKLLDENEITGERAYRHIEKFLQQRFKNLDENKYRKSLTTARMFDAKMISNKIVDVHPKRKNFFRLKHD